MRKILEPITLEKCEKYKLKCEIDLETGNLAKNVIFESRSGIIF